MTYSCEACHGPGSEHIDWAEKVEAGSSPDIYPDMGLVVRLERYRQCHLDLRSRFGHRPAFGSKAIGRTGADVLQVPFPQGRSHRGLLPWRILAGYPLALPAGGRTLYFPDGQIQDEVYVYASFLQSKMYQAGVVCKDCHEPHSGQVYVNGNALCYRCHMATEYGPRKHHFHDPAKEGASCFECHMHERTYMVVDPRRDHSIRIPRPDLSDKLGTPNACNQCHPDKSTQWATDYLRKWYGEDLLDQPHYGEAFWAGRMRYPEAQQELLRLGADPDQAPMIRATAISLLGGYPMQPPLNCYEKRLLIPIH